MNRESNKNIHTSPSARTPCVLVAFCAITVSMGCAGPAQSEGPAIPVPTTSEHLLEAIHLTAQGERAQEQGDIDAAKALYEEAITLSSDAPSAAWNNLGMLYLEQGAYLQARRYLSTASHLSPLDPQPMYNLGLAYHKAGWARQALESFLLALDREPNYILAIRGAATATMLLRLTEEDALDRLKHALLVETDLKWRSVFERQRFAMESRLDIENR